MKGLYVTVLSGELDLVDIFQKLYIFLSPLSSMMKIHGAMYKPAKRQISEQRSESRD